MPGEFKRFTTEFQPTFVAVLMDNELLVPSGKWESISIGSKFRRPGEADIITNSNVLWWPDIPDDRSTDGQA